MTSRAAICSAALVASLLGMGLAGAGARADTPGSLHELLCDRTVHVYYGIGNQIEFLAANGDSYFWLPGSAVVIEGAWRIGETQEGGAQICFQYAEDALRPGYDGEEFCFSGDWFLGTFLRDGLRDGDPYNLRSGTPPYVLAAQPPLDIASLSMDFPDDARSTSCSANLS